MWNNIKQKLFPSKEEEITEQEIEAKTNECNEFFDQLHLCVKRHGWNDQYWEKNYMEKYEEWIKERDKMQAKFYDSYA